MAGYVERTSGTRAMADTIFLIGQSQKDYAKRRIDEAPADTVCKIAKATRSDRQNRKMWAMIKDLQDQVIGFDAYTRDDIKLRFLNALGVEMRYLPALESEGMFPVGMRSSTLTKAQFAGLIELMFQYGARHDVRWSREAMEVV